MLSRFLNNWPYKLLAVALAVVLRVYVGNTMNPRSSKTMTVPIYVHDVPNNLVVTDSTQNVVLQISGTPSVIDSLGPSDIGATVNASHAHAGPNIALPILITMAPDLRNQVERDSMTPNGAAVFLDTKASELLKIHPDFSRTAPTGYQYALPTIVPAFARVDGPQSVLNTINRLMVSPEVETTGQNNPTSIEDTDADIYPVDSHNVEVNGVSVTPKQAHIIIPIQKVGEFKSLVISPLIVGSPKYPLRVSQVDVNPTMIIVSGPESLLSQTSVILTDPVDLSQQTDTFSQMVRLNIPNGLAALQSLSVDVTVHMTASQPASGSSPGLSISSGH